MSPFVRFVQHVAALTGDSVDLIETVPPRVATAGEASPAGFTEASPFGLIPAAEIDGVRVFDSQAMARYLANGKPEYPTQHPREALLADMGVGAGATLLDATLPLATQLTVLSDKAALPPLQTYLKLRAAVASRLAQLERSQVFSTPLFCGQFLFGKSQPSIGDCMLYAALTQVRTFGLLPVTASAHPRLLTWMRAMDSHAATARVYTPFTSAALAACSMRINLLIPMAGAGSRFAAAGYLRPKPMIPVRGKPMVRMVIDNILAPNITATYIYVVQRAHYDEYGLRDMFEQVTPGCKIVCLDGITEGAACTCLAAREYIDNATPLLIANSDQFIEWDPSQFYADMRATQCYGGILCFVDPTRNPKWSFARCDDTGNVVEVAEKRPISDHATVGVYYWARGADFVRDTDAMIAKNVRVNNEFYVCPVYNEAIAEGRCVRVSLCERMWGTGTPEDLKHFEANYHGPC